MSIQYSCTNCQETKVVSNIDEIGKWKKYRNKEETKIMAVLCPNCYKNYCKEMDDVYDKYMNLKEDAERKIKLKYKIEGLL